MHSDSGGKRPEALSLLASERPRIVGWAQAAGLLFGDWGTSRLYVLGLAFLFAGRTSFYLILMMSLLIVAVGWAYSQICRIYPDGGGVYTAARNKSRTLAVIGALLLFADYTVTASLSSLDAFHYFGLPVQHHAAVVEGEAAARSGKETATVKDAGDYLNVESEPHTFLESVPKSAADSPTFIALMKYEPAEHRLSFEGKSWVVFDRPMTYDEDQQLESLAPKTPYAAAVQKLYIDSQPNQTESLLAWDSPGLWAIISLIAIGLFNLLGPGHSSAFALFAAAGMTGITLLIALFAIPQMSWHDLPHRMAPLFATHGLFSHPGEAWIAFVSIVLALSGVEAIANLTGVMQKPVSRTAGRAILVVTAEVAIFNVLLALAMTAIYPLDRSQHTNDMLAYLAQHYTNAYLGHIGEWSVRIVGGLLLLSAANTAVNGLMSIVYIVSRDNELPAFFQKVNRYGAPWMAAVVATAVPVLILIVSHDLEALAALYAIGVIGAVAINVTLCSFHPRLRRLHRKGPMIILGLVLMAIWVTLAFTKLHALLFVITVMVVGLIARAVTKKVAERKGPRQSLLRQAIVEQLPSESLAKAKILLGTYGSESLAPAALQEAKKSNAMLVVCFIRNVALSYRYNENRLTIDTDLAALKTFSRFLELGHQMSVPVLPVYDTGPDAAELMAENAAIYGCERVLIGTSRQGALFHLIKGHFQRRLEAILPPEIPVQVISPTEAPEEVIAATSN